MTDIAAPNDILDFWADAGGKKWWMKDESFDAEIRHRFGTTLEAAERGELDDWQTTPDGALALIIVLDQFSRNLYRNSAKAFSNDPKALTAAKAALDRGDDEKMREDIMVFAYLPLEHSENIGDQRQCLELMKATGTEAYINAGQQHYDIIEQFGRFPHRNKVLGRDTTPAEQAFLDAGGFSG
jgi:uncharacterized protein (DUF924 family)